jgi:phosphonate transport system substrate-binding protein
MCAKKKGQAMSPRRVLALVFALGITAFALPGFAEVTLSFGVYTRTKPTTMVEIYRPLLSALESWMSQELGEPVRIKMRVAKTYEEGIEDLVAGRVDFSQLGPVSYVYAKQQNPGISMLAVETEGGQKVRDGIICVHRDSQIQSPHDLKGKTFAFGDELSTTGRYLPQAYLLQHNIKSSDLGRYDYLGRHDKVGTAVGSGQFDAGAINDETFSQLVANGAPLRVLVSYPVVGKPWLARNGLSQRHADALRRALLGMKAPVLLKPLEKDGFLEGSDEDYASTREAIQNNGAFFQ